jgi:mRNA interferase HigB
VLLALGCAYAMHGFAAAVARDRPTRAPSGGPSSPWWCWSASLQMRIIARRALREFVESLDGHKDQPEVKAALDAWFYETTKARWKNTDDIKRSYAASSFVTAERVVFNIKGNAYRSVVAVDFEKGIVWIKWIGTHRDHDRIEVTEVKHGR